jgi:hypothetical protein
MVPKLIESLEVASFVNFFVTNVESSAMKGTS